VSGPYDDLAAPDLLDELPQLVRELSAVIGLPGEDRVWVVYGSRVTGSTTATSDFDVMVLHHNDEWPPTRLDGTYRDAPVTIYAVSWSALHADGQDRAYGGYFALKLFSPFVCSHPNRYPELVASVAQFLAPMAADIAKKREVIQRTRHQILADSYLAFLTIYPDFDSYAARLLQEPVLASALWLRQAQVVVDAYEQAQLIKPVGANRYVYCTSTASEDICHQRAIAAARFWAFGDVCHGADPGFPDRYRRKARQRTTPAQRRRVRASLQRISHGRADL
jgi:hypothetical protein